MPTLEEIAKLAHVSRSTVSRVINNDPNVHQRTRQRVLQVIEENHFQPNRAARSLRSGRTGVLGLVIPQGVSRLFTDPYYPLLIQGVIAACNAHECTVMLWLAEPEYERLMIGQILHNGLIDGVIVAAMLLNDPLVEALSGGNLPFILVGRHPTLAEVSYVDVDNRGGAHQAVSHLLRQGRRRVATIAGPQNMGVGMDRLEGYRDALRARGLHLDTALIVEGDFTESSGYEGVLRLLPHEPDALFVASDAMAFGALRALREAGRRVPEDVAVVGFDDLPPSAHTDPPLTTVRQPIVRTGSVAAETLLELIDSPSPTPRRIVLSAELALRASSGQFSL